MRYDLSGGQPGLERRGSGQKATRPAVRQVEPIGVGALSPEMIDNRVVLPPVGPMRP